MTALTAHMGITFCLLSVWTFGRCPPWGLAAAAMCMSLLDLSLYQLRTVMDNQSEGRLRDKLSQLGMALLNAWYHWGCWWIMALSTHRALWPGGDNPKRSNGWGRKDTGPPPLTSIGRLKAHFYSVMAAFAAFAISNTLMQRELPTVTSVALAMGTTTRLVLASFVRNPKLLFALVGLTFSLTIASMLFAFHWLE